MTLPPLAATIFALIGDLSDDVAPLAEKRPLPCPVRADTINASLPLDPVVPIRSEQIPAGGPPAFTRGVRWDPCSPVGYRTLTAHDITGQMVMRLTVSEEKGTDDLIERIWAWLDREYPETQPGAPDSEPRFPPLRLHA